MSFEKVRKELGRGLPSPVYLVYGDAFLLDSVRNQAIRTLFKEGEADFSMDVFHAASSAPEEIVTAAETLPFLTPRRLVIVLEAERLKKAGIGVLERILENPCPSTLLMILAGKVDKRTGIYAAVNKRKLPILVATVTEKEIPLWVEAQAGEMGFRFEKGAAMFLVERVGGDLSTLRREVEKCALLGKEVVTGEDVEELRASSRDFAPFDITAELQRGNLGAAFRILNNLLDGGQEPASLIGILRWHYSRQFGKRKGLDRVIEALHEADVALKSTGRPPRLVLEALLLRLLAAT